MSRALLPDEVELLNGYTKILRKKYHVKNEVVSFRTNCWEDKMLYIVLEDTRECREKLIKILQDKNNQDEWINHN